MPRIQDHLSKLSWVAADRVLFVLYGVVALFQIRALPPSEYGLYALLVSIQTWIFVLADGLILQGVVQFGAERDNRPTLDGTAALLYIGTIVALVSVLLISEPLLSRIFREPRFQDVAWREVLFCLVTIPRTFSLRLLQRDIQPRQIFWIDAAWLGTMSGATIYGVSSGWLRSFESLAAIAIGGMMLSSLAALWICRGLLRLTKPAWRVIIRLIRFGLGQMSASAVHTSVRQLDVVLAQMFFGTAAVGAYQAAKTIFRFFELGIDAAASVVYPAAVRFYHDRRTDELHAVTTKALSVIVVMYAGVCTAIWLSGDVIGVVLGERYALSVGLLQIASLAAVVMPLSLCGVVLVAAGRIGTHAAITMLAAGIAAALFIGSGSAGMLPLFPLGIVGYFAVLGVGDCWALNRSGLIAVRMRDVWRSIPELVRFVRQRMK